MSALDKIMNIIDEPFSVRDVAVTVGSALRDSALAWGKDYRFRKLDAIRFDDYVLFYIDDQKFKITIEEIGQK